MRSSGSAALSPFPSLFLGAIEEAEELDHPAVNCRAPSPSQGPSLLALQDLQQLDLTACSQLTDASLAKVWGKGHGRLRTWGWSPRPLQGAG